MKSYLRFLSRNKLYTAIEIVGLSLALAFAIPVINWFIQYQQSRHAYEDYANTWTLTKLGRIGSAPGLGSYLKDNVPEIDKVSTADMRGETFDVDGYEASVFKVDEMFFDLFPIRFIEGDRSFIEVPTQICVSEKYARHLAEDGQPIVGREVQLGENSYMVAAVMEDQGTGSIRYSDIMMPLGEVKGNNRFSHECVTIFTAKDTTGVRQKIRKACTDFYGPSDYEDEEKHIFLVRYDEFCTYPGQYAFVSRPVGIGIAIGVICIFMLAIAIMNYCNLAVAIATKRAKEFAARKLVGADSMMIYRTMFVETAIFCSVCFLISIPLSKPMAELISGIMLRLNLNSSTLYFSFGTAEISLYMTLIISTALISALPPAVMINHFTPLDVTKGEFRYYSKKVTSKIFLCIQMIIAVLLISVTMTMHRSHWLLITESANCDIDDVLYLVPSEYEKFPFEMMLSELEKCPKVHAVGLTFGAPNESMHASFKLESGYNGFEYIFCDEEAFELYGFHGKESLGAGNHGLWVSDGLEKHLEVFPEIQEYMYMKMGMENIVGRMETFSTMAGNFKHSKPVVGVVTRSQMLEMNPSLVIKTIKDHNAARKAISDIYSKATGEIVTDIHHFGRFSGYLTYDIMNHYYGEHQDVVNSLGLITLIIYLMVFSGLCGISIYFTSEQKKQTAIRQTFGADIRKEVWRMMKSYMRITAIADIIAIPLVYLFMTYMNISIADRLADKLIICMIAIMISLLTCFIAVFWQAYTTSRTNPSEVLKKE